MATFHYEGRSRQGKKTGKVQAASKRQAMQKMRDEGIRVISIEEVPETFLTKEITFSRPIKQPQLIMFFRQFATLLEAGVTIVSAVQILAEQTENKRLNKILKEIESELTEGKALSDTFHNYPKVFEPFVINMLKAGELSGTMDETLERLADHFEKQYELKQKIVSAMTYPVVVGLVAFAVVIFLLIGVVPTFVELFQGFDAELPFMTQLVLTSSEWMRTYWYLLLSLILLISAGLYIGRKNTRTKYYFDLILLRLPVIGKVYQKAELARMTRTLSSLFSSSVPIIQAVSMTERVVGNEVIARVLHEARDKLEAGRSLSEPMQSHWAFPPLIPQMIAIGEQTGALDHMLGKVADFYEKEVNAATDRLKSLIEPAMILLLAGIVGTIVSAIIIPMFDIFNNIQNY